MYTGIEKGESEGGFSTTSSTYSIFQELKTKTDTRLRVSSANNIDCQKKKELFT